MEDIGEFLITNLDTGETQSIYDVATGTGTQPIARLPDAVDADELGTSLGGAAAASCPVILLPQGEGARVIIQGSCDAKDKKGARHAVYVLTVSRHSRKEGSPSEWLVFRRYRDFLALQDSLRKRGIMIPVAFPGKRWLMGPTDDEFLARRRAGLQSWIAAVTAPVVPSVFDVAELQLFLAAGADSPPQGIDAAQYAALLASMRASTSNPNAMPAPSSGSAHTAVSMPIPMPMASPRAVRPAVAATATVLPSRGANAATNGSPGGAPAGGVQLASDGPAPAALGGTGQSARSRLGLDSFTLIRVIGKGSFGKVLLVRKKDAHGAMFAMKILSKSNIVKRKQVEHTITERRVLAYTQHPFIVQLHYAFQTKEKLFLVLDYAAGGELFFHLGRLGRFSEAMAGFYTAQLVLAIGHLHRRGIVYRDLKPENVLLDSDGNVKLADFGLSKEGITASTEGTRSFCGTPEYLAPEILDRKGHGTGVDWWSLGMLLYEMLTGLPPWYTRDRKKLYDRLRTAPLEFPTHISEQACSLLRGLLTRDPAQRLGAKVDAVELMQHEFFSALGIDFQALYRKKVPPPFVPHLNTSMDARYFDSQFTNLPPTTSLDDERAAALQPNANGDSKADQGLSHSLFVDFTYEEPSQLAAHAMHRDSRSLSLALALNGPSLSSEHLPSSASPSLPNASRRSMRGSALVPGLLRTISAEVAASIVGAPSLLHRVAVTATASVSPATGAGLASPASPVSPAVPHLVGSLRSCTGTASPPLTAAGAAIGSLNDRAALAALKTLPASLVSSPLAGVQTSGPSHGLQINSSAQHSIQPRPPAASPVVRTLAVHS